MLVPEGYRACAQLLAAPYCTKHMKHMVGKDTHIYTRACAHTPQATQHEGATPTAAKEADALAAAATAARAEAAAVAAAATEVPLLVPLVDLPLQAQQQQQQLQQEQRVSGQPVVQLVCCADRLVSTDGQLVVV